jgi:phosphoribosylamine--glycine ligase
MSSRCSEVRILIVGSGGREHALAHRCVVEGHHVIVAPGSDGIAADARCVAVQTSEHERLVELARAERVDLVVIGPEQPLVDGLADRLRAAGVLTVGPSAAAARLEGSKADAKAFMARHGIPTAASQTVHSLADGLAALAVFSAPPVIKASGLAAGKGVTVPESFAEAEAALRDCLEGHVFGAAGATVVLEERLDGEEVSLLVLTDGTRALTFEPAQDHKRLLDGDLGPNTGGMGAYAPAPLLDSIRRERALVEIVEPTLAGLRAEGRPFVGVLFVGLMIDAGGAARVIEYNCRLGDPEAQPILFGARGEVVPHLLAASRGVLVPGHLAGRAAATVVMASSGYPRASGAAVPITGLDAAAAAEDVKIFHAGTRLRDGQWWATGGRVLGVCARGARLEEALARAYSACDQISFTGSQARRDIGARARG